jgi:hypothetical protein
MLPAGGCASSLHAAKRSTQTSIKMDTICNGFFIGNSPLFYAE